jgi:hypothetical protein
MRRFIRRCGTMISKQTVAVMTLALTLGAASAPHDASAQLPSASTAQLATANNYTALARGFTAIALNPAGLGMPDNLGFSMALLPVQARVGVNAINVADLSAFEGILVPNETKEEWLQSVTDKGILSTRTGVAATYLALTAGPIGLQVSTVGELNTSLGPDAFELVMFGNAGRTGSTRDMTLAGTGADGWLASTAAASIGFPISGGGGDNSMAVGATVKYTIGHAVAEIRDQGSIHQASPALIDLSLPMIVPDTAFGSDNYTHGTGVGLDLGFAWEGPTFTIGVSVENVFNTFQWEIDAMAYRPGAVYADKDSTSTNFDQQVATNAPMSIQDEILAQEFKPAINIGVAFRPSDRFAISADFRDDSGETLMIGEGSHIGVGTEIRLIPFIPMRAGVSRIEGGAVHIAGGVGLELGPLHLSAGYLVEKQSDGEFRAASVGLSFAHN